MKLSELFEAVGFKLYIEEPYGSGFDPDPVKKGEVLVRDDGSEVAFIRIHDDAKTLDVRDDEMNVIEVTVKDVAGIVLRADVSVQGRKGFAR